MMKGKTKIILTNVETGEVEVHEDENLITGALDKIINLEMAVNHAPNSRILPIAGNLLGGILLFDGALTEDADNIHFPAEAHLIGYAGQNTNTSDKFRGSYNSVESGKTLTGFTSVWDFGTTQANGTIKAVARTHAHAGQNPIYYFLNPDNDSVSNGAPTTDRDWVPIRSDGEYLYMLKGNSTTHVMRLARVRIPMLSFGAGDYLNTVRSYEVLAAWSTELFTYTYYTSNRRYQYDVTVYADDTAYYEDGHDGYIYCMGFGPTSGRDTDYTYDLHYFTINYGDESYDKSETVKMQTGLSTYAYNEREGRFARRDYGHIYQGTYYWVNGSRKIVYKLPLSNPSSYSAFRIFADEEDDYFVRFDYVIHPSGVMTFFAYHYTETSWFYRNGILYPDGTFLIVEANYSGQNSNHGVSYHYDYCRCMDDCLSAFCYVYNNSQNSAAYMGWAANYLGTINNLSSPIQKTAAQTMKIVYTLTDVDEDEGD